MNSTNTATLRINGFGACMISGVPYSKEESFFSLFLQKLEQERGEAIEHDVVSLGGFPANRACCHVLRALKNNPDYVVVQFGATDVTVSLMNTILRRSSSRSPQSSAPKQKCTISMKPFHLTLFRRLIEYVKFFACYWLNVKPIHGDADDYINSISSICKDIQSQGATPILLSPFPHGDSVSNYWAKKYSLLAKEYALKSQVLFVDVFSELSQFDLNYILLEDRLHLSKEGHQIVASSLFHDFPRRSPAHRKCHSFLQRRVLVHN